MTIRDPARTPLPVLLPLFLLNGCAALHPRDPAQPLPHFFQVDASLSRGGQPQPEGFRQLAAMGVKTVISLRAEDARRREHERQLVESLGMRWVSLPMHSYWRPSHDQVKTFLRIVSDPNRQPVFVHCHKGKDRTGALIAVYRIVRQGWSPARAYQEARSRGLSWWNPFLRYLILHEARRGYAHALERALTS